MSDDWYYDDDDHYSMNDFYRDTEFEMDQQKLESEIQSSYSWKKIKDKVTLTSLKIVGHEKIDELNAVNPQVIAYVDYQIAHIQDHWDDHPKKSTEVFDMDNVEYFHTGNVRAEYDYNSLLLCTQGIQNMLRDEHNIIETVTVTMYSKDHFVINIGGEPWIISDNIGDMDQCGVESYIEKACIKEVIKRYTKMGYDFT